MQIDNAKYNYLNEPVVYYMVLRGYGNKSDREITAILIEQIWHSKIIGINKELLMPQKHSFADVNNILRVPNDKICRIKEFDKEMAYSIRKRIEKGIVICNSGRNMTALKNKLEELGEGFVGINNAMCIHELSEVTNRFDKTIEIIKSHEDYDSMLSDATKMQMAMESYKEWAAEEDKVKEDE